jgi:hypothetical protein
MYAPSDRVIVFDKKRMKRNDGKLALLHELGHAHLDHKMYKYDMELINMEMDAWDYARDMAERFNIPIDEAHIAATIASYDAWLSKRATCPDCANFSLQSGRDAYACFACGSKWTVNWRKDRRVKRTVTERYRHIHAVA